MIVDSREPKEIINKLKGKKDLLVVEDFIECGDYLLSDGYAIERKTIQDFVASISDKRLFTQLNSLVQYDNPILAIINDNKWEAFYFCHNRYIHNVYLGTLTTIMLSYSKVKIMQFDTENEFISFIASLEKKINEDGKSHERPKVLMRKPESLQDRKENSLSCAKSIGIKTAKVCLAKYKTLEDLCRASERELEAIIGKKAAENLYEMLHK
jgi:ERCC4-type nuclease